MSSSKRLDYNDVQTLRSRLEEAVRREVLVRRRPANNALAMYAGRAGGPVSPKWNVIIYRPDRTVLHSAVVCVDFDVLTKIWHRDYAGLMPSLREVVAIDDAGWGFPLLGALVGVARGEKMQHSHVPVEFFQNPAMARKDYLVEYSRRGQELVKQLGVSAEHNRVEICSGYLNSQLREDLRAEGYEVRVVEIRGVLQDNLERVFADLVKKTVAADIYYDPKGMPGYGVAKAYKRAVAYGRKNCPQLLKTGWAKLQGDV